MQMTSFHQGDSFESPCVHQAEGRRGQALPFALPVALPVAVAAQHHRRVQEAPRPDVAARFEIFAQRRFNAARRATRGDARSDDRTGLAAVLEPAFCASARRASRSSATASLIQRPRVRAGASRNPPFGVGQVEQGRKVEFPGAKVEKTARFDNVKEAGRGQTAVHAAIGQRPLQKHAQCVGAHGLCAASSAQLPDHAFGLLRGCAGNRKGVPDPVSRLDQDQRQFRLAAPLRHDRKGLRADAVHDARECPLNARAGHGVQAGNALAAAIRDQFIQARLNRTVAKPAPHHRNKRRRRGDRTGPFHTVRQARDDCLTHRFRNRTKA